MDGDFWYHCDSRIVAADVATIDNSIFQYEGVWNSEGNANTAFVPVSFQYLVEKEATTPPDTGMDMGALGAAILAGVLSIGVGLVLYRNRQKIPR